MEWQNEITETKKNGEERVDDREGWRRLAIKNAEKREPRMRGTEKVTEKINKN